MTVFASGLSVGRTIPRQLWLTLSRRSLLYPLPIAGTQKSISRRINSPPHQSQNRCLSSSPQNNADVGQHDNNNPGSRFSLSYPWAAELVWQLRQNNFKKCGFVVYRCDYSSDSTWKQYKAYINRVTRDAMRDLPGIDCEVTFVEDEDFLDGASNYKIRKRHRKWAESAIRDENPRWEPPEKTSWWHGNPRYDYFVTLDALPLWYNQMSTPLDDQRSFKLHATDWFRKKGLEMLNFNSWDVMEWRRHRGWVKLRMNWFQMDLYEDLWGREPGDALQRIKWKRERDEDTIRLYLGGKWRYD